MVSLTESTVELVTLDWLHALGYSILHGQDIVPDAPTADRADFRQVMLVGRLRSTLLPKRISGELCVKEVKRPSIATI